MATASNRTAEVKYVRSYIPGGLEWSLFLSGNGHWVRILPSIDATAKFSTEEAAIRCGAIWVHFGIQPCDQKDEHQAKLDELIASSSERRAA